MDLLTESQGRKYANFFRYELVVVRFHPIWQPPEQGNVGLFLYTIDRLEWLFKIRQSNNQLHVCTTSVTEGEVSGVKLV